MKTIGILGGGQLARMLALAAAPLAIKVRCYEPATPACASDVCEVIQGEFNDIDKLTQFAQNCDVVTFENENIPLDLAQQLEKNSKLYPSSDALKYSQDRLIEKTLCQDLAIDTPKFIAVNNADDLYHAKTSLGFPFIVKTRRFGYDGKGQYMIKTDSDIEQLINNWPDASLIAEEFISFDFEVSLITVKSTNELTYYPLALNTHKHGILRYSQAPYVDDSLFKQAQLISQKLIKRLNYCGVFTVEFFAKDNKLYVNEMAPRVHNSGHWSIDGAYTSQFENHIRAITNLPLGSCNAITSTTMINCIGKVPATSSLLKHPEVKLHNYNKPGRPLRKVGHINVLSENKALTHELIEFLAGSD